MKAGHDAGHKIQIGKIMADLFAISNAVIDEGKTVAEVGLIDRINHELSELGDGIAILEHSRIANDVSSGRRYLSPRCTRTWLSSTRLMRVW